MTPDPTAAFERHVDRLTGADDIDCPTCGEPVRLGHSCDGCGWSVADLYEDVDAVVDAIREARG